jgi:hypothetical protein
MSALIDLIKPILSWLFDLLLADLINWLKAKFGKPAAPAAVPLKAEDKKDAPKS